MPDPNLQLRISEIQPINSAKSTIPDELSGLVELPCLAACERLANGGIATVSSSANYKNVGNYATISIDADLLCVANDARIRTRMKAEPDKISESTTNHWGHIFVLNIPIPNADTRAAEINDQFLALLDRIGFLRQPAFEYAPVHIKDLHSHPLFSQSIKKLPANPNIEDISATIWCEYNPETSTFTSYEASNNEYYARTLKDSEPGTTMQVSSGGRRL